METVFEKSRALTTVLLTSLVFYSFSPLQKIEAKAPPKIEKRLVIKKNPNGAYKSSALGGRPSAWCGWWMRTQKGGGPEFNLARNWAKRGERLNGPEVGAVVVWPHHVGMITGRTERGLWIVKSGNDGNAVRERARSVSGAIAFRRV